MERFSYDLEKYMVSVSVRYLFYQPMDEKIKTWAKTEKSKDYWKTDSEQLVVFS